MRRLMLLLAILPGGLSGLCAQMLSDIVRPLPAPTGSQPIGTSIAYLIDGSRREPDFPDGRPITIQLWYPAADSGGAKAPYLAEAGLPGLLRRLQYYGVDSGTVAAWARIATHAALDARPATGRHPLIAFSVGLGVIRAQYTSLAEELASHGMIVMIVESPLQGVIALPDGREIFDSAGQYGDAAAHADGVVEWAGDISVALTRLERGEATGTLGAVAASVDWNRIGAAGHSSGGLVAIATCETDARVRACANLDGGLVGPGGVPLAHFTSTGAAKPTLLLRSQPLYDDTTLARRGITREEWEARGRLGLAAIEEFAKRSRGPVWQVQVAGTGHFSFSDAPFVMPTAITRFGGRIIAPERGWRVITTTIRAFFKSQIDHSDRELDGLAAHWPELTVRRPRSR